VAALFQPIRRRVQRLVDRRFNRIRYDAERTVAAFSDRLRDEVDLEALRAEILATVSAAVEPTSVSLWLRE
jgi:predicted unusual protein kinase regulating ubiquinone biosynthesis (AarF/ABC1/UbiB family)